MGDSSGKAKSSGSSKAGMQKKQGQAEANEVLQDLGYRTEGQKVFSDTGQVAGEGWSGSRTVDAVRDAAYQVGLEPGGLGKSVRGTRSPKEVRQLAAITGMPIEDVRAQAENVSEIYGRPAEVRLGVDKFGNPMAYGAAAPTLSEFGGDIYRGIVGGTYGSRLRGEEAPEGYKGIGPLVDLMMPGGLLRNMYQGGKEFVTGPIDYTKNLFSGIFSPSATQAVEMNPRTQAYLETFKPTPKREGSNSQDGLEKMPNMDPDFEQVLPIEPLVGGYDASVQPSIIYPSGTGSTLVSYEDILNQIT